MESAAVGRCRGSAGLGVNMRVRKKLITNASRNLSQAGTWTNGAMRCGSCYDGVHGGNFRTVILAAVLLLAAGLGGCSITSVPPCMVQAGPSFSVRYALARVSPAVVRIDVVMRSFQDGLPVSFRAIGSGVIIDSKGHVLTNFHVAGRARHIMITLADQRQVHARLIGADHWTDLALVQMNMKEIHKRHLHFSWASLGNSRSVQLGQAVLAIGTPYGLSRTVTRGIISNTDRFFSASTIDGYETGWFNNWLQTDAAINPGNSGGPLINLRGQVIGINTRGDPSANNLGFAIPINVARRVIPYLLSQGRVPRSYIGLRLQPLRNLGRFYHLSNRKGVLIRSVDPHSPASKAGLQPQDVLISVNAHPTNCRFPEQLAAILRYIADRPIGSTLALKVDRPGVGGPTTHFTLKVITQRLRSAVTPQHEIAVWGIAVRNLTPAYLRQRRMKLISGVLVTGVRPGSMADRAGMQPDDIIRRVNGMAVISVRQLKQIVGKLKAKATAAVVVKRGRSEHTLVLSPHH